MEKTKSQSTDEELNPGRDLKTYVENRFELFSISIAEQIATAISGSIQKLVGFIFLLAGVLFIWIALGFFLGDLLKNQALGFLIAGLPPLFVGMVLYNRSSKKMEEKIQSQIIFNVTKQLKSSFRNDEKDERKKTSS